MTPLLRLQPFRAIAYRLIDANLFRHPLEERLKRDYIVMDARPSSGEAPATPAVLDSFRSVAAEEQPAEFPAAAVRHAATGG